MDATARPTDGLRVPAAAGLLDAWEQGMAAPTALRPLALLAAAYPGTTPPGLARLSLGRRDAALLALRAALFGPDLLAVAPCPACGTRNEFSFQVADIALPVDPGMGDEVLELAWEDYAIRFRLPNSLDLAHLAAASAEGGPALLGRCLAGVTRRDPEPAGGSAELAGGAEGAVQAPGEGPAASVTVSELPAGAIAAIEAAMAAADPQADIQLALACQECGHEWRAPFDIAAFLWTEVDAWAQRTLYDVHLLARAYGWREADVLALSPVRRQAYIELALA